MKIARIIAPLALAAMAPAVYAGYALQPYTAYTTGSWADAVAIGDVNGDGRDDVVLTTTAYFDEANDNKVFVYFQKADGTLDLPRKYGYQAGANRNGLALADLDGDGRLEIVVGHGAGITLLDWGPVHGRMDMRVTLHPFEDDMRPLGADDIAVVDVNRDGALDVVGQSWSYGANVYFGDGRGGIARQAWMDTPADGYNDLETGDFNHDGYEDLVVLSGQGTTHAYVYYNDGSDDFSPPLEIDPALDGYATVGALGAGDFDGDGRDDLAIMSDRTHVSLYRQDAAGGMQAPLVLAAAFDPNAMVGHDLDLDGMDDLVVLHGSGPLGVYLQGESGLAAEAITSDPYGTWFNTQGLAVGDINGDACPDVATANYNAGLVVNLGSGCNAVADLAPSLGLTASIVALRLDNFGAASAATPEAKVSLSVFNGTLAAGALPDGCVVDAQAARSVAITCTGAALPAGTSRTLLLPISIAGGDLRNTLNASAIVSTTTPESRLDNNRVDKRLRLGSSVIRPAPSTASKTRERAR